MKTLYKVEHNVPIPTSTSNVAQFLSALKVGDSFVCPKDERASIAGCALRLGIRITTRKVSATEVRVWRIESDPEPKTVVKGKVAIATP